MSVLPCPFAVAQGGARSTHALPNRGARRGGRNHHHHAGRRNSTQRKSCYVDTKGVCCRKHEVHATGTERRDKIRGAQQQLQLKPGDWDSRRGTSAARAKQES